MTGAGTGIGRATVVRLVAEGATVLATDVSADGLADTAAAAEGPGSVQVLVGDVTDPAHPPAVVDAAGRLDLLVNAAGILRFEHSHE